MRHLLIFACAGDGGKLHSGQQSLLMHTKSNTKTNQKFSLLNDIGTRSPMQASRQKTTQAGEQKTLHQNNQLKRHTTTQTARPKQSDIPIPD